MKKYLFSCLLVFCLGNLMANDSTQIKFVNKTILIQNGEKFLSFSIKKETLLLIPVPNSDSISCFIFKNNRLTSTGKLVIKRVNESKIAFRNGYWRFFNKAQRQEKTYYMDDEKLIMDDKIPLENEMQ